MWNSQKCSHSSASRAKGETQFTQSHLLGFAMQHQVNTHRCYSFYKRKLCYSRYECGTDKNAAIHLHHVQKEKHNSLKSPARFCNAAPGQYPSVLQLLQAKAMLQ